MLNYLAMEKEQQELYEYARKRIQQKKNLYYHFVFFLIGSLFMFVANVLLKFGEPRIWYIWAVTVWFFLIILHFIKVYITDRFMNKNWEREQIDRLVKRQERKIQQMSAKIDNTKQ
jgi:hypothetical protein